MSKNRPVKLLLHGQRNVIKCQKVAFSPQISAVTFSIRRSAVGFKIVLAMAVTVRRFRGEGIVVGSRRSLPEVIRRMRTAMPEVAAEYTQLPDSRRRRLANDRRFSGDCVGVSKERRLTSCVSNLQQSTSRDHVTSSLSRDCIRYFCVSSLCSAFSHISLHINLSKYLSRFSSVGDSAMPVRLSP